MSQAGLHALHVLLNTVDFVAWLGACGLMLARAGIVPHAAFALPGVAGRWGRGMLMCLALLLVTACALLIVRTMAMGGLALTEVPGILPAVLFQTHFGKVWLVHLALVAALLAGVALYLTAGRWPGMAGWVAACAMAALAFTYSATSHAGDQGDFTRPELNGWAHILACSAWGGAILAARFFAFPALRDQRELLAATICRMSALSAVALPGVLLTGLYNAALRISALADFAATAYGRTLAVKVALVAVMVLLGAYSRLIAIPAIRRAVRKGDAGQPGDARRQDDARRQMGRVGSALAMDAMLLLAVLAAASLLIQAMPPSSARTMTQGMQAAHRAM